MRFSRQVCLLLTVAVASAVRGTPILNGSQRRHYLELLLDSNHIVSLAPSEGLPRILLVPDVSSPRSSRSYACDHCRCGSVAIDMPPIHQHEDWRGSQIMDDRYYESDDQASYGLQPFVAGKKPEGVEKLGAPSGGTTLSSFAADAGWTAPLIPSGRFLEEIQTMKPSPSSDKIAKPLDQASVLSTHFVDEPTTPTRDEISLIVEDGPLQRTTEELPIYQPRPTVSSGLRHNLAQSSDDPRVVWRTSAPSYSTLRYTGRHSSDSTFSKRHIIAEVIGRTADERLLRKRQPSFHANKSYAEFERRENVNVLARSLTDRRAMSESDPAKFGQMEKRLKHDSNAFNSSMVGNGAGMYKYGHKIHDNTNGAAVHDSGLYNALLVSMALAATLGVYITL